MTVALSAPADTAFGELLTSLHHRIHVDASRITAKVDATTIQATSHPELRSQLAAAIYTHLHVGHPGIDKVAGTGHQDLAAALIEAIPHRYVVQSASVETPQTTSVQGLPHTIVGLAGVKVLFPTEALVHSSGGEIVGVRVPSWRNRTTPGFLLALGAHGSVNPVAAARLYIPCLNAAEALDVWTKVLRTLAASGLKHQVKALSSSLAFPRSDAMVIYVSASEAELAASLLHPVLGSLPPLDPPVSVFAHRLTDRLALAQEPHDQRPGYRGLSFGQHRSRVLADALLRASLEETMLEPVWTEEARTAYINPGEPGYNSGH